VWPGAGRDDGGGLVLLPAPPVPFWPLADALGLGAGLAGWCGWL
jgi:hypothetical protein